MPETIFISIWSDIACPWCFVGKARLEAALQTLAQDDDAPVVQIRWRAFELDPRPRERTDTPYVERLAVKYNRSVAEAQQMLDTMANAIRGAGGESDFNKVIAANTFDAHRLIQWAGDTDAEGATEDAQHRLTGALMHGYLAEGLDLRSHPAMLELVADIGLDAEQATGVLDGDAYSQTVRDDEQEAQRLGINGVPFFLLGGYGVSGAQEPDTLVEAIRTVQMELRSKVHHAS